MLYLVSDSARDCLVNSTSKITSPFLCKNVHEFNKCLANYITNCILCMIFFLLKIRFLISPKAHLNCQYILANTRHFRALRKLSKLSDEERARALGRIEAGIHLNYVIYQFNVHHYSTRATRTVSDRPRFEQPSMKTDTLQSL